MEAEYRAIVEQDGAPHTITPAELVRVQASFVQPELRRANLPSEVSITAVTVTRFPAIKAHNASVLCVGPDWRGPAFNDAPARRPD